MNSDVLRLFLETPLADTHNHLFPEADRVREKHDFTLLFDGYAVGVFHRCGMPETDIRRLGDKGLSPAAKWRLLAPYWPQARLTGVLRAQVHTVRDLFGVDDLDERSVATISEQIAATNQPGRTLSVLRDRARLHHVQVGAAGLFPETTEHEGFFTYDLIGTTLITGLALPELERRSGRAIHDLDGYLAAIDGCFRQFGTRACAIKAHNGYFRTLDYQPTPRADAERAFAVLDAKRPEGEYTPSAATRPLEDFIYHYLVGKAREYALPIRNHIGFTAACFHGIDGDRPYHLETVIKDHPDVRFILLHAGYPYLHETLGLCQSHPNAYADLSWVWQLNPAAAARFVREFVTAVGPRQLLTFGGDTGFPETTYGYSRVARHGLALAVGSLLDDGLLEPRDVDGLVERLCYRNAMECFRLAEKFGMREPQRQSGAGT